MDTTGGGQTQHLQHHDGSCEDALWCEEQGTGGVGPSYTQECFKATLTPPFDLIEVGYSIGKAQPLPNLALEIRAFAGGEPGAVIESVSLQPGEGAAGDHQILLQPPVKLQSSSFCVGLRSTGAFGMATDLAYGSPGTSFMRFDGCDITEFVEMSQSGAAQLGNWCLVATIEK